MLTVEHENLTFLGSSLGFAYFQPLFITLDQCTGDSDTYGQHLRLQTEPDARPGWILMSAQHQLYNGKLADWFSHWAGIQGWEGSSTCWRVYNEEIFCDGQRSTVRNQLVSLPVILVVELLQEGIANGTSDRPDVDWDVPATLTPPISPGIAKSHKIIYDLVGYGLVDHTGNHFTAQYQHPIDKQIHTYDGIKNDGYSTSIPNSKVNSHLAGSTPLLPATMVPSQVVYRLRGGVAAQKKFYQERMKELGHKFNLHSEEKSLDRDLPYLSYRGDNLSRMDTKFQIWNPKAIQDDLIIRFSEYVHPKLANSAPLLKKKGTLQYEDSLDLRSPSPEIENGLLVLEATQGVLHSLNNEDPPKVLEGGDVQDTTMVYSTEPVPTLDMTNTTQDTTVCLTEMVDSTEPGEPVVDVTDTAQDYTAETTLVDTEILPHTTKDGTVPMANVPVNTNLPPDTSGLHNVQVASPDSFLISQVLLPSTTDYSDPDKTVDSDKFNISRLQPFPMSPPPPTNTRQWIDIPPESHQDDFFEDQIACRCGKEVTRYGALRDNLGQLIKCTICGDWSHLACQQRAPSRKRILSMEFICDHCNPRQAVKEYTREDRENERP